MNRRVFIACASAAAVSPLAAGAGSAANVRLRFGVMTDTHVTRDPKSFERVDLAFKVFKKRGCDIFCHVGDLAEMCDPKAHRMWSEAVERAYPEGAPRAAYAYAAHDYYNYQGKRWKLTRDEIMQGYESFRKNAKLPNGMYAEFDVNGYPFVVTPQHVSEKDFEEMIARAEKKHAQGPIFVFHHVAPENTTFNSSDWGCWWLPRLYARHPRVVVFCGHTHGSLANERNIWQGGFTVVDAGCLAGWASSLPGGQTKVKQSYEVLVCDVLKDRIVMHRVDVRDGADIREPWVVPLPFDPATAPYALERRRASAPKVEFAEGAALEVDVKSDPESVTLSFPAAEKADDVFCYRIEAAKRGVLLEWEMIAREDVYGEFYLRAHERTGRLKCVIKRSSLNKSRPCRFTVTPVGFYGQSGRPLEKRLILR